MSEATITIRVDEALKNEFAKAAKSRDRTGAQLLRDFMRSYVREQKAQTEHEAWFHRQVQAGQQAADAGELLTSDAVEADAAAWRAHIQQKLDSNTR